jgi:hypothetical protein
VGKERFAVRRNVVCFDLDQPNKQKPELTPGAGLGVKLLVCSVCISQFVDLDPIGIA